MSSNLLIARKLFILTFLVTLIGAGFYYGSNILGLKISSVNQAQGQGGPVEVVAKIRADCTGEPIGTCFNKLSDWETAFGGINYGICPLGDLECADKIAVAEVYNDWGAVGLDDRLRIRSDWKTDATRYIKVYTPLDQRHDGTWGNGFMLTPGPGLPPVSIGASYVRIEGLALKVNGWNRNGIYVNPEPAGRYLAGEGEIQISHNLVKGARNWARVGIVVNDVKTSKIFNNIVYDFTCYDVTGGLGYPANYPADCDFDSKGISVNESDAYLYNNTIYNTNFGVATYAPGIKALKNNIVYDAFDGDRSWFCSGCTFDPQSTNNLTGPDIEGTLEGLDGSGPTNNGALVKFIDDTTADGDDYDLHLAPSDPGARGCGADLSADPMNSFDNDIDDETRPGGADWDIGADEYLGSQLPLPGPPVRPEEASQGLKAVYYPNNGGITWNDVDSITNDVGPLGVYIDPEINFNSDLRHSDPNGVVIRWSGYIYLPQRGNYTFRGLTDANAHFTMQLYKPNSLDVYVFGKGGPNDTSPPIDYLRAEVQSERFYEVHIPDAGWAYIELWYANANDAGTDKVELKWKRPCQAVEEIISSEYLYSLMQSDDIQYIPDLDSDPDKVTFNTAGVGMGEQSDANHRLNLTSNNLKITMPDYVMTEDIWAYWTGDRDITLDGHDISGNASNVAGTDLPTSVFSKNIGRAGFTFPAAGATWTLNVTKYDAQSDQHQKILYIYGNEVGAEIDKLLIARDGATCDDAAGTLFDGGKGPAANGGNNTNPGDCIWIEAEYYTSMSPYSDGSASDGKYVRADNTSQYSRFNFYISQSGSYSIYARVRSTGADNNSFNMKWRDTSTKVLWDFGNTVGNWNWEKIEMSDFENVQLTKNYNINDGVAIVVPYIDTDLPSTRRLAIQTFDQGYYKNVSDPMIIKFDPVKDGNLNVDPVLFFVDGETRYTEGSVRPNYLYWAHGDDDYFPTGHINFTDFGNGIGDLLVPQITNYNKSNDNTWFPAYGREGFQLDVISSRYVRNDSYPTDSGYGAISPLTLDVDDTWLALQALSGDPFDQSSGSGESMAWLGGGIMVANVRPNPPIVTCIPVYTNPPEFEWSDFDDPDPIDTQNAFQVQVAERIDGVCNFSDPLYDYPRPSDANRFLMPDSLVETMTYCWRVKVQDNSVHTFWSDWSSCIGGFTVGANLRPTAKADNKSGVVGIRVDLDGSDSFDPEICPLGDSPPGCACLGYDWTVVSEPQGSSVIFADSTICQVDFIPAVAGVYRFQLNVTDTDVSPVSDALDSDLIVTVMDPLDCGNDARDPGEGCDIGDDGLPNTLDDKPCLDGTQTCQLNCSCVGSANSSHWWEVHPFFEL